MTNPVAELLDKHGVQYMPSGKDFLTKCFNPDHDDKNPSFRIDQQTGVGHCFSCNFKFNIFKYYGVLTNNVGIKLQKLKARLKEVTESLNGLTFPDGHTPYSMPFRGISTNTLKKFGAFHTDKVPKLEDRIVFPITDITDKVSVFVGRHTLSNANPRYVNYPSGVKLPLFPSYLPKEDFTSLVLVEGLFDMLNLYDKGMRNAVCCFGTNTLQANTGEKLLPFKAQGITKIYILFDGDDAGRDAATRLKPLIEEHNFIVEIIDLPDDTDPGDLAQEDVKSIIHYTSQTQLIKE